MKNFQFMITTSTLEILASSWKIKISPINLQLPHLKMKKKLIKKNDHEQMGKM